MWLWERIKRLEYHEILGLCAVGTMGGYLAYAVYNMRNEGIRQNIELLDGLKDADAFREARNRLVSKLIS